MDKYNLLELKILYISYLFPPCAGSGTYRALYFSYWLQQYGAKIYMVSPDEQFYQEGVEIDKELLKNVHPGIHIIRTKVSRFLDTFLKIKNKNKKVGYLDNNSCNNIKSHKLDIYKKIKNSITDLLNFPDRHIGWVPYVVAKCRKIIKNNNITFILSTGGPWSAIIAGVLLKKLTNIPLILDFRDPWVSNPNFKDLSYISQQLQIILEKKCLQSANMIITNTDEAKLDFLKKYSFLNNDIVHTITNGYEIINDVNNKKSNEKFTITHLGALYSNRNPIKLIEAVYQLINEKIIPASSIQLNFIGGIDIKDIKLEKLLNSDCLNNVILIKSRVPYKDTYFYKHNSDVLLIIQQDYPLQIPRKLYDYLDAGKPILAITNLDGATANIIRNNKLGFVVDDDVIKLKEYIYNLFSYWSDEGQVFIKNNQIYKFKNSVLAKRLLDLMIKLSKSSV